ncbi:hypothetical protein HYALB_00000686 [Hymenoscyphus albidus]|uniref:C3H1-type domain-containing protein n=1 Tax=Hymenoscyphus albidus TaxID=595503 RepID=A0A9N9Q8M5_9HELO|nr:hypothetical protein HYALB_00000686 [Hymenoscyphus albidus]
MPPDKPQPLPLGESASTAPSTAKPSTGAEVPAARQVKECFKYNGGWIWKGFECPRERDGEVCPYNHNPALREVAIAKRKKQAEEKKAAKAALAASSDTIEKTSNPKQNDVQSLKPSPSGEALKNGPEKPNVSSESPSSAQSTLQEQQNSTSTKAVNPNRIKKKCRTYSKYGSCRKVGCVYRHVEPLNPQKPKEDTIKGADVKLSLVSSQSKDEPKPTVPTQNGFSPMLPQPTIGTPPPRLQNQFLPLLPIRTPSPQAQKEIEKFRPQPPIGTPPPRNTSPENKQGDGRMPSLASILGSVVAKKKKTSDEQPIVHIPIHTLLSDSQPLDRSIRLKPNEVCRMFQQTGACKYGTRCYRSHENPTPQSGCSSLQIPPESIVAGLENINHGVSALSGTVDIHSHQSEQLAVEPIKKENVVPAPNNNRTSTPFPNVSDVLQKQTTPINDQFCHVFANTGQCKFGTNCHYPHVNRAENDRLERLKKVQDLFSSPPSSTMTPQDISQEFSQSSDNTAIKNPQDVRQEFSQAPSKSFVGASQDIRLEFAQSLSKPLMRGSQKFSESVDTAFMRGSQGARQEIQVYASKLTTRSSSNIDSEALLAENPKPEFAGQNSMNSSSSQIHTAKPSSSNPSIATGLCNFYSRTGWCRHGEKCKYLHVDRQLTVPVTKDENAQQVTTRPLSFQSKISHQKVSTQDTTHPPKAGNLAQPFKYKRYPQHEALGQLDGTMDQPAAQHLEEQPSQRTLEIQEPRRVAPRPLIEQIISAIEKSSHPKERKNKHIQWWKADPLGEPSVTPGASMKVEHSSWSDVAKLPSQRASSSKANPGPVSVVKKAPLFEVPVVTYKIGMKHVEALPFDPNVRTTDMDCSGSWDQGGATLVRWLARNLDRETCAKVYQKYRNYLEQGVIPLNALKKKRHAHSKVSFPQFSRLPRELQTLVWKYALCHKNDAVIRTELRQLRYEKKLEVFPLSTPPLLHTCRFSREIARHDGKLQHYRKRFGVTPRVYFNFEFDRLVIRNAEATTFLDLCNKISGSELRRIQYLSVPMTHWMYNEEDYFKEGIVRLRGLQELTLYVGSNECDRLIWEPKNIRERLEKKVEKLWQKFYPAATPPRVLQEMIDPITAYHLGITDPRFSGTKVERETWGRKQARLDHEEKLYAEGKLLRPKECEIGSSRGIWEGLKD